jgi:hypothetical protein
MALGLVDGAGSEASIGWPSPVTSLEKALPEGARIFGKKAGGQRGMGGMKTLSSRARKEEEGWARAERRVSLEGLWGMGSSRHEMAVQMIVVPILRYLGGCFWDTRAPVGSGGTGVSESGSGVEVDRVGRNNAAAMVRSTRNTALTRFPAHRSGVRRTRRMASAPAMWVEKSTVMRVFGLAEELLVIFSATSLATSITSLMDFKD